MVRLVSLLAGACILGCGAREPRFDSTGTNAERIIRGTASDASQDAVVAIIHIDTSGGFSFEKCTGTLIAPNLVLTARHCLSVVPREEPFSCDAEGVGSAGGNIGKDTDPTQTYVFTGTKRPTGPKDVRASGIQIFHDGAKNLCNHDIALLLLNQDIEGVPIAPIRFDTKPEVGELITAVGWGVTTTAADPSVRQQRADIPITGVGPLLDRTGFPVPDREFRIGEGICQGDSGGPAFAQSGAVIGVVSRGGNGQEVDPNVPSSGCVNASNFYTQTTAYKDLILAAFAASGHEPWVEAGPDPRLAKDASPCQEDAECQSNLCLPTESGAVCAKDCTQASCASGLVCKPNASGERSACVKAPPPPPANDSATTTTVTSCGVTHREASPPFALGFVACALALRGRRRASRSAY